jgi:hypothetical protein
MSTDLEEALRTTGSDLTLQLPVADVLARGARIRRRRNRGRIAGAAAVLALCGVATVLVGTSDSTSPGPVATLRSSPEEQCRQTVVDEAPVPDGVTPVLTSAHDSEVAVIFRYDGRYAACVSRPRHGAWLADEGSSGPWRPMGQRAYRATAFSTTLVVQVSEDVVRVTLEVGGTVAEADIQGGYAVVWFPTAATHDEVVEDGVVTAYDADGAVLQQGQPYS